MKKAAVILVLLVLVCTWVVSASADVVFAFEYESYTLSVGANLQLTPILQGAEYPDKPAYNWTSSDPKVLTVSKGKITGKKAGTATVTCELLREKEVLYTTSCEVTVTQPIKSIKPEAKMIDIPFSIVRGKKYKFKLHPVLSPDGATGELSYKSLAPTIMAVNEQGEVTTGYSDPANVGYILIEAADGSGASAKQKIRCVSFAVNIDKLTLSERKVYRLRMPGDNAPLSLYHPFVTHDYKSLYITDLVKEEHSFYINHFDEETGEYWVDIRPVKPGKTTLSLWVDRVWFDSSPNYKITINIDESACYTEKNCPPLKYKEAYADAQSVAGQPVSLKGKFLRVYSEEGSSAVQFEIATKGNNEETVIVEFPAGTNPKRIPDLLPGDKVEVYGEFLAPIEKKTETGLTIATLRVAVSRFGNVVYTSDIEDVSLYDWGEQ